MHNMLGPLFRSRGDTNADMFFVYFIGLFESDLSKQGSFRPKEEEIGSHIPAPSQEQDRRGESSHGAVEGHNKHSWSR